MTFHLRTALAAAAVTAVLGTGFFIGQATADQPHMQGALDALRTARNELNNAARNKGGHRAKAIELVDSAIGEVQAGIAAGE